MDPIQDILDLEAELAKRNGDANSRSEPGPPASEAAIAAAEASRGKRFPPAYRAFLAKHDGWSHFEWGMSLYSTAQLTGKAYSRGFLDDTDDKVLPRIADALVIGANENDASLLLITDAGEVIEWLYEEKTAHADFDALLAAHANTLRVMIDDIDKTAAKVAQSADPKRRARQERALATKLRAVLAKAKRLPAPRPPPAAKRKPVAVKPTELVIKRGGEVVAEVSLHLVLYLGAYPTKAEVMAAFDAFRTRFPVTGELEWMPAGAFFPTTDDPSTIESKLRIIDGHFGLRASITTAKRKRYTINVRGVPPTEDDAALPRASFCEIILPASEDPQQLLALTHELVALLPVRSGHGGYAACVLDEDAEPDPSDKIFAWCRRFFGLDLGHVDGWLPGALARLHRASWITVLGPAFADELARAKRLVPRSLGSMTLQNGIAVVRTERGAVIRAGESPTLGDVQRGEFPAVIAEVDRAIDPLVIHGYEERSWMHLGGNFYDSLADDLPAMRSHRATAVYLRRFVDPAGFLAPTPRERAEAMLEQIGGAEWKAWQKEVRSGAPDFTELMAGLHDAAGDLKPKAAARLAALELVAQFEDGVPEAALNNLLWTYMARGEPKRALAIMDRALSFGEENPPIFHNAACVYAKLGNTKRAMELVLLAKKHGHDLELVRADSELAKLHALPAWKRLFGPESG